MTFFKILLFHTSLNNNHVGLTKIKQFFLLFLIIYTQIYLYVRFFTMVYKNAVNLAIIKM